MIESVRQTVLGLISKNNYGTITPSDFNMFAAQAQLEIFQNYFTKYNNQINLENARLSGTDYAALSKKIAEDIERFSVTNFLTPSSGNVFNAPSLTTTGDVAYMIGKILCYPTELATGNNSAVVANQLVNAAGLFTSKGISANDIVVNVATGAIARVVAVSSAMVITLTADIFTAFPVAYMILSASNVKEAEKVSQGKITQLATSLLTAPNNIFPAYSSEGLLITVLPTTLNDKGKVQAQYYRLPKTPRWSYVILSGGEPVFDASASDYQDFEVAEDELPNLVVRICQMAGISLREAEVYQYAQNEQNEQKQQ